MWASRCYKVASVTCVSLWDKVAKPSRAIQMHSLKSIWVGCVLCVRLFCWENRQTDSANCRPFRLSPVFVILKCLASFFITCAILRYTECRKHSLYRFRGTSMPSRLPPLPEAVYMGFGADDRGRTGTGISSHGILSPLCFGGLKNERYFIKKGSNRLSYPRN